MRHLISDAYSAEQVLLNKQRSGVAELTQTVTRRFADKRRSTSLLSVNALLVILTNSFAYCAGETRVGHGLDPSMCRIGLGRMINPPVFIVL